MSDAREILDQRLAKGEITEDDHERLVKRMSAAPTLLDVSATVPEKVSGGAETVREIANIGKSFGSWVGKGVLAFVIGFAVFSFVKGDVGKNLTLGNIEAYGQSVKFKISNGGKATGDALAWIEQNGNESCNHYFTVKAGYTHTITMYCPQLRDGQFTVYHAWSRDYPKRHVISTKIE